MEGFNQLQKLGSKAISSKTHIPVMHIESILNKEFAKFQKPQFFGFVSILEREYKIDLSALKQEFLFTRAEEEISNETVFDITDTNSKLFEKRKSLLRNKKVIYGAVGGLVVLLVAALISMLDLSPTPEQKIEINNTAIDQAKKNLNLYPAHSSNVEEMMRNNVIESAEFGQEANDATLEHEENKEAVPVEKVKEAVETIETLEPVSSTEPIMPLYLRLVPRGELWVGIINTETHKRRAETITEPLILDAHQNWLIITGYGHLEMDCGDTTNKYRENKKLLFLYENGICQMIDEEEFKARNKGKLW